MSKKVVHGQGREIIYKVFQFMQREKEAKDFVIPVNCLFQRVATATGVGLSTVKRIVKEGATKPEGGNFDCPRQTINKPSPKTTVNQSDEEIIRKVIDNLMSVPNCNLTMAALYSAVKEEGVQLTGTLSSFRLIVKRLGFMWVKTKDNRQILVEKIDTKGKKARHLRQIKQRKEGEFRFIPVECKEEDNNERPEKIKEEDDDDFSSRDCKEEDRNFINFEQSFVKKCKEEEDDDENYWNFSPEKCKEENIDNGATYSHSPPSILHNLLLK